MHCVLHGWHADGDAPMVRAGACRSSNTLRRTLRCPGTTASAQRMGVNPIHIHTNTAHLLHAAGGRDLKASAGTPRQCKHPWTRVRKGGPTYIIRCKVEPGDPCAFHFARGDETHRSFDRKNSCSSNHVGGRECFQKITKRSTCPGL